MIRLLLAIGAAACFGAAYLSMSAHAELHEQTRTHEQQKAGPMIDEAGQLLITSVPAVEFVGM